MAWPSRRWILRPQPVEQKPQTIVVVSSGLRRLGTLPRPNLAGCRTRSSVSGPSNCRNNSAIFGIELTWGAGHAIGRDRDKEKVAFEQLSYETKNKRQDR